MIDQKNVRKNIVPSWLRWFLKTKVRTFNRFLKKKSLFSTKTKNFGFDEVTRWTGLPAVKHIHDFAEQLHVFCLTTHLKLFHATSFFLFFMKYQKTSDLVEELNLYAIDVAVINHNSIYTLANLILAQHHCKKTGGGGQIDPPGVFQNCIF